MISGVCQTAKLITYHAFVLHITYFTYVAHIGRFTHFNNIKLNLIKELLRIIYKPKFSYLQIPIQMRLPIKF